MAIFMILGSFIGTKFAIHRGVKLVKPLFAIMSLLVAGKLILQYY